MIVVQPFHPGGVVPYPRVCGGDPPKDDHTVHPVGISPRMRGDPMVADYMKERENLSLRMQG